LDETRDDLDLNNEGKLQLGTRIYENMIGMGRIRDGRSM